MNLIPKTAVAIALLTATSFTVNAQKIKLTEGDLSVLKGQTEINTEFNYDHVSVGDYKEEKDYIERKKSDYNKKEPGSGDKWEIAWKSDRQARFEPRFNESFTDAGPIKAGKFPAAKYTLIFKTTFIEPGFNVGVARKKATMDGEAWIVETADKGKVVAKLSVDKAPGRLAFGADFDTGVRIMESYATAGKQLANFVEKETK
ncbi:hypothetical protein [Chitinophaga tropicalis]|uniref:DUF4468 domain-containing protein n=1 Tax=Chitinophaga tropicalis TaxID=2683588 RepID=A0A7K1U6V5_9BACT|nr:hypothetical protein [Chitinophaga tropicalis]MVT10093.1 hypothetical protein [Chitinophaga tropicalis]